MFQKDLFYFSCSEVIIMYKKYSILFSFLFISFIPFAQQVQNASSKKDAPVDVFVTDFKNNPLRNEIILFKGSKNDVEYQGLTNDEGKFSIRIPSGDRYEYFFLGFKDSISYNFLDIPLPTENTSYKKPFKVNIQHQPPKTFVLEDCNFETGKAMLEPESYTVLDELVAYLVRKDDERIEIGGHTDNVGTAANNLKLSQERAESVRSYLISRGIAEDRVTAKGYGMTQPVADNKKEDGRAQNRRTEVKIL